jgi:glycosyltransferase involved in cell wall biosynthesis
LDASIIIPVKNGARYISECLESCFLQKTDYNFEIILVDDHSSDDTLHRAEQFKSSLKIPFKILRSRGNGISDALNTGIAESSAQFIIRIDADDRMKQDRVQSQVSYAQINPNLVLLGSQIEFIGDFNPKNKPNLYPSSDLDLRKKLSYGCFFAHPSVLIRKKILDQLGGYNSKMDGAEDYELWLLLSSYGTIENFNYVLTEYRVHPNQFTVSKRKKSLIATAKVRIFFILRLGRFRFRSKNNFSQISRINMSQALVSEFSRYLISLIKVKRNHV